MCDDNEVYDEENIPDEWWTNGYCSIFAFALKQRFGLPMHAILERANKDGDMTLLHAVAVHDGIAYDADGRHEIKGLLTPYRQAHANAKAGFCALAFTYYPGEDSTIQFVRISEQRLGNIHHDFDPDMVHHALAFIDRHPERYAALKPKGS